MRYSAHVALDELRSDFVPEAVPYAAIAPQGNDTGPFKSWWSDGSLPPMVLASPSAGMSYYLEDPAASVHWDGFIAESFVERLRATCNTRTGRSSTVITGMSMGGFGALKVAFA